MYSTVSSIRLEQDNRQSKRSLRERARIDTIGRQARRERQSAYANGRLRRISIYLHTSQSPFAGSNRVSFRRLVRLSVL